MFQGNEKEIPADLCSISNIIVLFFYLQAGKHRLFLNILLFGKLLLASREIENILDNTDFMILLSQAQSDRAILARQLGISEHQLSYITHSNSGEGLLFYGNVTIPFVDRFPKGEIYNLLTTRPEDMKNETKTE